MSKITAQSKWFRTQRESWEPDDFGRCEGAPVIGAYQRTVEAESPTDSVINDFLGIGIRNAFSLVAGGPVQSRSLAIRDHTDRSAIIFHRHRQRNGPPTVAAIGVVPILQLRHNAANSSKDHNCSLLPVRAEVTALNDGIPRADCAEIADLTPELVRRQR